MLNTNQTIGEIAGQHPATIAFFDSLGIHYCCNGQQTIDQAAQAAGVSSQDLLDGLARATESRRGGEVRWVDPILEALILRLAQSTKKVVESDLPRIRTLARSVVHLDDRTETNMPEVGFLAQALADQLETHLTAETKTLFPMIQTVEVAYVGAHSATLQGKKFRHTVGHMVHEHEEIGYLLSSIRRLTDDYQGDPSMQSAYRTLCDELKSLDREIREQVHLENNVLFNRALQFSQALWPSAAVRH